MGMWRRMDDSCVPVTPSFVIYYSNPTNQLLWLPAACYPGVPATRLNVDALYTESLDTKLRWFYSQLAQTSGFVSF